MRKNHITAFYVETLLLILVFITIILVLTHVFGLGRAQSAAARELNDAVSLAQNAAEAVASSDSEAALLALLNENGNAAPLPDTAGVAARYGTDLRADPEGVYRVDVTWLPWESEGGALISSVIQVRCGEAPEPVYTLETAVWIKEAAG